MNYLEPKVQVKNILRRGNATTFSLTSAEDLKTLIKKSFKKKRGSLRGQWWKYRSEFVDGIFPVLSPIALQILNFLHEKVDVNRIWSSLDNLPPLLPLGTT